MPTQKIAIVAAVTLTLGLLAVSYTAAGWFLAGLAIPAILSAGINALAAMSEVTARRGITVATGWRPWLRAGALVAASVASMVAAVPFTRLHLLPPPEHVTLQVAIDYPSYAGVNQAPRTTSSLAYRVARIREAAPPVVVLNQAVGGKARYATLRNAGGFEPLDLSRALPAPPTLRTLQAFLAIDTRVIVDVTDSAKPIPVGLWRPPRSVSGLQLTLWPDEQLRNFIDTTRVKVEDSTPPSRYVASGIASAKAGLFLRGVQMMPLGASPDLLVQVRFLDGSLYLGMLCEDIDCTPTVVDVRGLPHGTFYQARDAIGGEWQTTHYGALEFVTWRVGNLKAGVAFTYISGLAIYAVGPARAFLWVDSWPRLFLILLALVVSVLIGYSGLSRGGKALWGVYSDWRDRSRPKAGFRS